MMGLGKNPSFASTSAAGPMRMRQSHEPLWVGLMLAGLGTSNTYVCSAELMRRPPLAMEQTTAGAPLVVHSPSGAAIAELRRLSGFTWEQLARLFNVNRRSLHFWASGKVMTPSHEERLQRLLAVIRKVDRGSASATRSALLAVREDGTLPFDLLASQQYELVVALLGTGKDRRVNVPAPSARTLEERAPRPPESLVDALQDRVHATSGRLLAAKAVTLPRRK